MPRYKKINQLPMWAMASAAVAAALLIVGCGNGSGQQAGRSHVPEVAVVTVEPQPIELTTELPGRTSAYLVSEIRPQVSGLIQKRLFTEGSDVKAGQVLYQIEPAPFQAALANANLHPLVSFRAELLRVDFQVLGANLGVVAREALAAAGVHVALEQHLGRFFRVDARAVVVDAPRHVGLRRIIDMDIGKGDPVLAELLGFAGLLSIGLVFVAAGYVWPEGATITLNGEVRQEKTPAMLKLPAGRYRIRLTLPGKPPYEDTVEVKDQVLSNIGVEW